MGCWANLKSSNWAYPTAVLSLYGFFANCRIAEPFLAPYLIGPHKNISEEVVTNYLFPIWTYSSLAFLFPVFLLTDLLRHKPIVVLQGLFLVINYVLLCFAQGVPAMVFLEINYAMVTASEVAYFSYIYSVIPLENYQRATGYLRSAMLFGYTFGAGMGQVLISLAGLDYFNINTITLGVVSMAFLISFWLPMPQRSMFFKERKAKHLDQTSDQARSIGADRPDETVLDEEDAGSEKQKMERHDSGCWCSKKNVVNAGHLLWQSFRESYSSRHLIYWSLWWALATAGYTQILNYIQLMWNHIEPSATSSVYNGGTMMTIIFVDEATLRLDIVTQFIIYGSYYAAISVLFVIRGTYTACTKHASPDTNPAVKGRGGCWSLLQLSSGERRGTPWTGGQPITGHI
uniref:thiamine transporter 2-like isoform X5 n=1 Tax=Doryrhamphus excisus TaxID=161450 RepID=UPI0025ADC63B|nr:thiamine transporter 2-like isoform X5 [Doryrhamphus excisus]